MADRRKHGGDEHGSFHRTHTTLTRESSFVAYASGDYTESGSDYTGSEEDLDSEYDSNEYYTDDYSDNGHPSESNYDDSEYTDDYSSGDLSEYYTEDASYYTDQENASMRSDPSFRESKYKSRQKTKFPPIKRRSHTSPHVSSMHVASHRTITVYRNGDGHFPGRAVIVGPMFRSFEYLLDWITTRIRSPFGAVRRLYKLPDGSPCNSLAEIEDGASYVAARQEKYQPLPYTMILDYTTRQRTYVKPDLEKMKYKQRKVKGRNAVEHPMTIYCLANGDQDGVITKVILRNRDRTDFAHVLDIVTEKLGYAKLPSVAKKLIDMETRESVTNLMGLQDGHFYVAIDRLDQVRMPNFRVHPNTRELIPVIKRHKKKVKNLPIMFDGPIRGKIYCGKSRVEEREARGYDSKVGRVTLQKRRLPKELPPIKQPYPMIGHKATDATDGVARRNVHLKNTPKDRAIWKFIHKLIDDETQTLVERSLDEMHQEVMKLLNDFVVNRCKKPAKRLAKYEEVDMVTPEPPRETPPPPPISPKGKKIDDGAAAVDTGVADGGDSKSTRKAKVKLTVEEEEDPNVYNFDDCAAMVVSYMSRSPDKSVFRPNVTGDDKDMLLVLKGAMQAALAGKLRHWENAADKLVALIILLDQIPRRAFARRPEMYSGDQMSRDVIFRAMADNKLIHRIKSPKTLFWICTALSHQEDSDSQKTALKLYNDIKRHFSKAEQEHALSMLKKNRDIIAEFGRFPQRNEVLGRAGNSHEQRWLEAQLSSPDRQKTDKSKALEHGKDRRRGGTIRRLLRGSVKK